MIKLLTNYLFLAIQSCSCFLILIPEVQITSTINHIKDYNNNNKNDLGKKSRTQNRIF